MKKVVLDMDTGVDDAVAIVFALNSPELDVLAITTVAGNARVKECTRNCLLLSELVRPDDPPPVAEGAASPLERELVTAPEVHGRDGLGGEQGTLPAPEREADPVKAHELMIALAKKYPGEITLVATGPLTNVARAIIRDRDAVRLFERIVIMGGAFRVPGNTGLVAEFNFYVDPDAARIVLRAGLKSTIVPLDATIQSVLLRTDLALPPKEARNPRRRPERDLSVILHRALDYYFRFQELESGLDGGYMHDPLAVAAAIEPSIVKSVLASVEVIPRGEDRGRSFIRPPTSRTANVHVALEPDLRAFRKLLAERVLRPVFRSDLPPLP